MGRWRPAKASGDQVQIIRPDGTGTNVDGSRFLWRFEGRHLAVRREGTPAESEMMLTIRFSRDANTYELTLNGGHVQAAFERLGDDGKPVGHRDASGAVYPDEPQVVPDLLPVGQRKPPGRLVVHVDSSEAPELRDWAADVAGRMPRWYPRIVEALGLPETPPVLELKLVLKGGDRPEGETQGRTIIVSSKWIAGHEEEDDRKSVAAHEMVHVLQHYGTGAPGWLLEGIPEYIRYFVLAPGTSPGFVLRVADYTNGYLPTASMLDWVERTRGPGVVARLNLSLREGTYSDELFEKLAGCKPQEAWRRYVASIKTIDETGRVK